MMGGVAPMASPNSRPGFIAPASKNRVIIAGGGGGVVGQTPQSPLPMSPAQQQQPGFQHPSMSRPVSVQIPRPGQLQQQRMQSPFSPQQQHPPQSPHDQFPLSPATQANNGDPFSRPPSENSQQDPYLNVSFIWFCSAGVCILASETRSTCTAYPQNVNNLRLTHLVESNVLKIDFQVYREMCLHIV